MAKVLLRGVSKVYPGPVAALRHLDLEVADRELLVLVGPSGCGKTTTLRLIAGLETPSEGALEIGDRPMVGVPPRDRDIAMMFQDYALYPHLSVYKNMAFGLELRHGRGWLGRQIRRILARGRAATAATPIAEIRSQVVLTARLLGIEHLLDRLPGQLSGGERQRVALGRAIVRRPAAFLLDEPLSQLDAGLRVSMRREIRTLHEREGATTIYVTHDQEEALSMGDRIAVMNEGRVQQIGTGDDLLRQPGNRFVAGFIGMPPMNFVPLKLRDGGHHVQLDCGGQSRTWDKPVPWRHWPTGGQVLLGVRPQDIRLAAASHESGWKGKISVVESSGEFNLIHVDLFDVQATWVCRVEPAATYRRGEPVSISWSSDREHWFDAQTGNNLACQC